MAAKKKYQNAVAENGRSKQGSGTPNKSKTNKRKEKENGHTNGGPQSEKEGVNVVYLTFVLALACICGLLHRNHLAHMFESDRHFSHLSSLERELAFRTEMGLYYSYYKTIIRADTVGQGLHAIMYDNVTEYGQTINTLKRFNLYPEVVVGLLYRWFESAAAALDIKTKTCWKVNRGQGLSPVQSCEGLGDEAYFYVENVFLLNGINMAVFFIFGTYLSGSVFGGFLAVASFFYNHGECTRVQWTPPLRESFAYPFLVLQLLIVTYTLRQKRPNYKHSIAIAISTACFMLPWQFAQFALMTQTVAVFGTYVLQFIGSHKLKVVIFGQMMGLLISYVCLFGNEMLLTSFFAACLLSVTIAVLMEPLIEKLRFRILIWFVQVVVLGAGTLGLKYAVTKLLRVADDKHIGDIFRSKFTNFANFHTMLYTCAAEFDFMEKETPWRVLKTLLAPCAVISIIAFTIKILKNEYRGYKANKQVVVGNGKTHEQLEGEHDSSSDISHRSKPHAEILYHVFQLLAYTAMAVIIMRLKLFWTPHLCLMTSLLASKEFFGWMGDKTRHMSIIAVILALMSIQGYQNITQQWSIMGEFSNYPLEQVVEWINHKSPKDAVFAGPMPTMATVKLCTNRPIVNHPHYEDAGLRERTKKVYTMYSRKPAKEVWQHLRDLKADYAILEESWCIRRSKHGCGMAEIWDLEDKVNTDPTPTCAKLHRSEGPYFKRVFRNEQYDILKVLETPSKR